MRAFECEVCGNRYDGLFEVKMAHEMKSHWIDCIECAAQALAPECEHCGVRVLGHGVQVGERVYCCAHCARGEGFSRVKDHSSEEIDEEAVVMDRRFEIKGNALK